MSGNIENSDQLEQFQGLVRECFQLAAKLVSGWEELESDKFLTINVDGHRAEVIYNIQIGGVFLESAVDLVLDKLSTGKRIQRGITTYADYVSRLNKEENTPEKTSIANTLLNMCLGCRPVIH